MPVATTPATPAGAPPAAANQQAAMPASKPEMASGKPAAHPMHVSACTLSIKKAEKVLAKTTVSADTIATAWQHIDAAKQDRLNHQAKACKTEGQTAQKILEGKA